MNINSSNNSEPGMTMLRKTAVGNGKVPGDDRKASVTDVDESSVLDALKSLSNTLQVRQFLLSSMVKNNIIQSNLDIKTTFGLLWPKWSL